MKIWATGLSALSAVALTLPAAAATLTGVEFSAGYFVPTDTTAYDMSSCTPSTFTVGAGVETACQIENVTVFATDFGDTSLRVDFTTSLTNPRLNDAAFSGLVYDAESSLASLGLSGFTINAATMFQGFTADRVLFDGNRIGLNLAGLTYNTGDVIALDFQTADAVPEPATWAMMLLGFAAVGITLRRRREGMQPASC